MLGLINRTPAYAITGAILFSVFPIWWSSNNLPNHHYFALTAIILSIIAGFGAVGFVCYRHQLLKES